MAIKKIRMRPEGINDYADTLHPETNVRNVLMPDGVKSLDAKLTEMDLAHNEHKAEIATEIELGHIKLSDIPKHSFKTGTVSNGGTIPKTSGFNNYMYFVSVNKQNDMGSGGMYGGASTCSVNQTTRVVAIYNSQSGYSNIGGIANYLEIAWT